MAADGTATGPLGPNGGNGPRGLEPPGLTPPPINIPNPLDGITNTLSGIFTPITHLISVLSNPDFWKRAGIVIAGVLFIILAAVVLLKDPIESTVKAVT